MKRHLVGCAAAGILAATALSSTTILPALAAQRRPATAAAATFVTSWIGPAHGPYPSGNAAAQPELRFAFPDPAAGANDQTFRLIVKPGLWGPAFRIRLTNIFGTRPVMFDEIYLGVQAGAGHLVRGSNRRVTFGGKHMITVPAGASIFSDPVRGVWPSSVAQGPVARSVAQGFSPVPAAEGHKLAISFHTVGATGPMTWHAKALQTSYVSAPRAGAHGADESDRALPYTTTSWYFVDAVEVEAPRGTRVICAFGDSITDGTGSTLNGDDRWPDILSRRLRLEHGNKFSVVNAGIGGNRILTPERYPPAAPFAGGPSALHRLDRDLLQLSGLSAVILLEGINDISAGASSDAIIAGIRELVSRIRSKGGVAVIGATITSALGANGNAGTADADQRRRAVNAFIRSSGVFDAVADFDAATADPRTGALREEYQPGSTIGGAGDRLHPNRAGYQAMADAIDLALLAR